MTDQDLRKLFAFMEFMGWRFKNSTVEPLIQLPDPPKIPGFRVTRI